MVISGRVVLGLAMWVDAVLLLGVGVLRADAIRSASGDVGGGCSEECIGAEVRVVILIDVLVVGGLRAARVGVELDGVVYVDVGWPWAGRDVVRRSSSTPGIIPLLFLFFFFFLFFLFFLFIVFFALDPPGSLRGRRLRLIHSIPASVYMSFFLYIIGIVIGFL